MRKDFEEKLSYYYFNIKSYKWRIFYEEKEKNIYTNKFWYLNTYKSLGSHWLQESIEKLPLNRENYVLVNLSANAGYYEKEVYENHFKKYTPTYYIGDIVASKLINTKATTSRQFHYIEGDNNAITMQPSKIPDKANILIDCKGALWHTIADKKSNKKQLLLLLENYSELLNNSGVLLIDYYKINFIKFFFQNLKWTLKKYNDKPTFIDCFGELSTYAYLINLYGRKNIDTLLKPLNIKEDRPYFPLSKIMDTAYISKDNFEKLIEITKSTSELKFTFAKFKRLIKFVFLCLATISVAFFIIFLLILGCIFFVKM